MDMISRKKNDFFLVFVSKHWLLVHAGTTSSVVVLTSTLNVCFGSIIKTLVGTRWDYLERGGSNKYPQCVFWINKKNPATPQSPVLLYNSGVEGGIHCTYMFRGVFRPTASKLLEFLAVLIC